MPLTFFLRPLASVLLCLPLYCAAIELGPSDPLFANSSVSSSIASSELDGQDPCALPPPLSPLSLLDATEHALCTNPKTRAAWANVKVQAAQLGQARAAYLPTISITASATHEFTSTRVGHYPTLNTDQKQRFQSQSANLNWVLYDFGARAAALQQAQSLLAAAEASQDAELQAAMANSAKDYYAALAAQASVAATLEAENIARQSLKTAQARMDHGVAPLSEQLRAKTAFDQARSNRIKAQGDADTKIGMLAIDIGLSPDQAPSLAPLPRGALAEVNFVRPVRELLALARQTHPELLAARQQLAAAQANEDAVRAQGRPSLSLQASIGRNTQPESLYTGQPLVNANTHQRSIALQLTIPFFEGFSRTYKIGGAEAQVEQQQAQLAQAEQQVEQNVWSSAHALQTALANLSATQDLQDAARAALGSEQRRYQAGVADIQEMLEVQNSLASAEQQHIQGIADWYTARIQLANAIGTLGMWAVR